MAEKPQNEGWLEHKKRLWKQVEGAASEGMDEFKKIKAVKYLEETVDKKWAERIAKDKRYEHSGFDLYEHPGAAKYMPYDVFNKRLYKHAKFRNHYLILEKPEFLNYLKRGDEWKFFGLFAGKGDMETDVKLVADKLKHLGDNPFVERVLKLLLGVNDKTNHPFKFFPLYHECACAERILKDAAKGRSDYFLTNIRVPDKGAPYLKKMCLEQLRNHYLVESFFKYSYRFTKLSYYGELVDKAVDIYKKAGKKLGLKKYVYAFIDRPYGPNLLREFVTKSTKKSKDKYVNYYSRMDLLNSYHRWVNLEDSTEMLLKLLNGDSGLFQTVFHGGPQMKALPIPLKKKLVKKMVYDLYKTYSDKVFAMTPDFMGEPYYIEVMGEVLKRLLRSEKGVKLACNSPEYFNATSFAKPFFMAAAKKYPRVVARTADRIANESYGNEVMDMIAKTSPEVMYSYSGFIKRPMFLWEAKWKEFEGILKNVAFLTAADNPVEFFESINNIAGQPYRDTLVDIAANKILEKDDFDSFLRFFPLYASRPYAKDSLRMVIIKAPRAFIRHRDSLRPHVDGYGEHIRVAAFAVVDDYPNSLTGMPKSFFELDYSLEILERMYKSNPGLFGDWGRREFDGDFYLDRLKKESKNPYVLKMLDLRKVGKTNDHIMAFMPYLVEGKMTWQQAEKLIEDPKKMMKMLLDLYNRPDFKGGVAFDRQFDRLFLRVVRMVNDYHEEKDEVRFKDVDKYTPAVVYTAMVYGEAEIYTSSFNGMFDRLLAKMKKDKIGGDKLLESVKYNKFRSFFKLLANFGRTDEFLATMSQGARMKVLRKFVQNIEYSKDMLSESVIVADAFTVIKDPKVLKIFQEGLQKEFKRAKMMRSADGVKIYGLLSGMFGKTALINKGWFEKIAEKYKIRNVESIPAAELYNEGGVNVQRHYFYEDSDGQASFAHFLSAYSGKKGWKVEKKESYVRIVSTGGAKKVVIYANRPDFLKDADKAIVEELEKKKVKFIVVVHRGHSYHAAKTIKNITKIARIVYLGSCGGYTNVANVLKNAPDAHIISTKGTGTMAVNDFVLRSLNERILDGNDIVWQDFWADLGKTMGKNKDFNSYIAPHKNMGVLFLKAYNKLK